MTFFYGLDSRLNKLSINIDKTHCMSFKNDIIFNINIDNTFLSQVTSTKFLGINLDTCLNWKCLWLILKINY